MVLVITGMVVSVLLTVIPYWMICSRAGFPQALSLLMLVLMANVILRFYIAFVEWSALKQRPVGAAPVTP